MGGDGDGFKLSSGNDHSGKGVWGVSIENSGPDMGALNAELDSELLDAIFCGVLKVIRAGVA